MPIESSGSRAAYGDMVTFASAVSDRRAADLLQRALEGRGAFRRFRDTLHEFEDLVGPWRAYAQARSERRAIDWLVNEGHVDPADAEVATTTRDAAASSVLESVGQHERPASRRGRARWTVGRHRGRRGRRSRGDVAAQRRAVGDDHPDVTHSPSAARSRSGSMAPMSSGPGTGNEASSRVSSSRPIGSPAASRGVRPPRAGIDSSSHRRS